MANLVVVIPDSANGIACPAKIRALLAFCSFSICVDSSVVDTWRSGDDDVEGGEKRILGILVVR